MTLNMDEKHCLMRVRERIKSNTQSIVVGKTMLDLASHHFFLKEAGCNVIESLLSSVDSMTVQVCFQVYMCKLSIYNLHVPILLNQYNHRSILPVADNDT
jgi:hypothetical protein